MHYRYVVFSNLFLQIQHNLDVNLAERFMVTETEGPSTLRREWSSRLLCPRDGMHALHVKDILSNSI